MMDLSAEKYSREIERIHLLNQYEESLHQRGIRYIAGVDEVGRGPLAGPVIAGAVILPRDCRILGLNDSKKVSEKKRKILEKEIKAKALSWAIGGVIPREIDRINIYQATKLAMKLAVQKLHLPPEHLIIDAMKLTEVDLPQTSIIKGDEKSASVAAASILAKCHRDRLMELYEKRFPGYGFQQHKGYPTQAHRTAILKLGLSSIHRVTFQVKEI
ncbi:ribonuclease HII [Dehalobacterium formicoaceticum]|uniref:ribonuclease HII n=1 Tax=Dehalobacterium formicoaceticum TaxID=51515 RepID=UPI000B7FDEAF|nr:ribonuclease HII [Dehalobacterium formicoaceticum]